MLFGHLLGQPTHSSYDGDDDDDDFSIHAIIRLSIFLSLFILSWLIFLSSFFELFHLLSLFNSTFSLPVSLCIFFPSVYLISLSFYLSISLYFLSLSLPPYLYLSPSLSIYLSLSESLSISLSVYLSLYLSLLLSPYASLSLSLCLSIPLPLSLSLHLSISLCMFFFHFSLLLTWHLFSVFDFLSSFYIISAILYLLLLLSPSSLNSCSLYYSKMEDA